MIRSPPQRSFKTYNATNLAGATDSILTLTGVQQSQAGNYAVVITNEYGSITSSNAVLTVLPPVPPSISSQPANQTVTIDGIAVFDVIASGTPPLAYQWNFNGTTITGATNEALVLLDVQTNEAGLYSVDITNPGGALLSSNAFLAVVPPPTNLPIITAFSPALGPAGTVVTISGLNFSTSPGANLVRFGAVQALVGSASATNLVVTVPPGATYAPLSVTVGGLTAYASFPFIPTFPGGGGLMAPTCSPATTRRHWS